MAKIHHQTQSYITVMIKHKRYMKMKLKKLKIHSHYVLKESKDTICLQGEYW